MESFNKGNPLGLKLMSQMQSEAEPESEMTGEQLAELMAMGAEEADIIADKLHAHTPVSSDEPPAEGMYATWSKWAQENLPEE